MTYLKATIFTVVVLIVSLTGYFFFVFDTNDQADAKQTTINLKQDLPPSRFNLLLAYIEEGNYLQCRQLLEKETLSDYDESEASFLMGLSYVKEAEDKPEIAAMPYYRLAQPYFARIPIHHERFAREKQYLIKQYKKTAHYFLEQKAFEGMVFFTGILEEWNAHLELEALAADLANLLYCQPDLSTALKRLLKEGKLQLLTSQHLELSTLNAIARGDTTHMIHYWETAKRFSLDPEDFSENVSQHLVKQTLASIKGDDEQLTKTFEYLFFWDKIEQNSKSRYLFANLLIAFSGSLWIEGCQETKAFNLMARAASLPYLTEQKTARDSITQELTNAYILALRNNAINKLSALHSAAKHFQINSLDPNKKNEIANQMADAEFLFRFERYLETQKRLEWVLSLDPDNTSAKQLLGLCLYHLEHYSEAAKTLSTLSELPSDIQEILAISQVLSDHPNKGLWTLESLAEQRSLTDQAYTLLGFASIKSQNYAKGSKWLLQLRRPTLESSSVTCYCAYQLQDWEGALSAFYLLTSPHNQLGGIQAIAIKSLIQQQKLDLAEQLLTKALHEKPGVITGLSPWFQEFKTQKLDTLDGEDLMGLAGLFFKEIRQDQEKALSYLIQTNSTSPKILLARGELFSQFGELEKCEHDLRQAADLAQDEPIKERALALLAPLYLQKGRLNEALDAYSRYFTLAPEALFQRNQYAQLLTQSNQWEAATEQYKLLKEKGNLSQEDAIASIRCLVKVGKEEEAIQEAEAFVKQWRKISLLPLIKLARATVPTSYRGVISLALERVASCPQLSFREKQELIGMYIDLGDFAQAEALAGEMPL